MKGTSKMIKALLGGGLMLALLLGLTWGAVMASPQEGAVVEEVVIDVKPGSDPSGIFSINRGYQPKLTQASAVLSAPQLPSRVRPGQLPVLLPGLRLANNDGAR